MVINDLLKVNVGSTGRAYGEECCKSLIVANVIQACYANDEHKGAVGRREIQIQMKKPDLGLFTGYAQSSMIMTRRRKRFRINTAEINRVGSDSDKLQMDV